MMSWWVPQVVGTLVSTQKAQLQKVEKVRYGKFLSLVASLSQLPPCLPDSSP